jgi:fumarate reductase flavoprotein subunit
MKIGTKLLGIGACAIVAIAVAACGTPAAAPAAEGGVSGTATATAQGYIGEVTVTVTMVGGRITAVEASHAEETAGFWANAEAIADDIVRWNDWNVDTIAGATGSSGAIREAARLAIEQINAAAVQDAVPVASEEEEVAEE